jgi:hypothetical protein
MLMSFKKPCINNPYIYIYTLQYLYSTERIMAIKQENLEVFNNSWKCWSNLLQNRDHS